MAQLTIQEVKKLIAQDPAYEENWKDGVSVEQSLYVIFQDSKDKVRSQVFELADGGDIVLDINNEGKVQGIEIM